MSGEAHKIGGKQGKMFLQPQGRSGPDLEVMDFKDLKTIVQESVIYKLDHALILSQAFLASMPDLPREKLIRFEYEPTAENLLIFIRNEIIKSLPEHVQLIALRLWETRDSYAEWSA